MALHHTTSFQDSVYRRINSLPKLDGQAGFEPVMSAWKAEVLPLHHCPLSILYGELPFVSVWRSPFASAYRCYVLRVNGSARLFARQIIGCGLQGIKFTNESTTHVSHLHWLFRYLILVVSDRLACYPRVIQPSPNRRAVAIIFFRHGLYAVVFHVCLNDFFISMFKSGSSKSTNRSIVSICAAV